MAGSNMFCSYRLILIITIGSNFNITKPVIGAIMYAFKYCTTFSINVFVTVYLIANCLHEDSAMGMMSYETTKC